MRSLGLALLLIVNNYALASITSEVESERVIKKGKVFVDTWSGMYKGEEGFYRSYKLDFPYETAKEFCKKSGFGGYKDWWLPTKKEMLYEIKNSLFGTKYHGEHKHYITSSINPSNEKEYVAINVGRWRGHDFFEKSETMNFTSGFLCIRSDEKINIGSIKKIKNKKIFEKSVALFKIAERKNTESSYINFIKNYPDATTLSAAHKALRNIYSVAYNEAGNNLEKLKLFVNKYPNAPEKNIATKNIYSISYSEANEKNSIYGYKEFIDLYPESSQAVEAKIKIYEMAYIDAKNENTARSFHDFIKINIDAPQVKDAIDQLFFIIERENNIQGYKWFVDNYQSSVHSIGAVERIYELIKVKDNIRGYEWFINNYPKSSRVREAIASVHKLAFSKALSINTISAYNTFIIAYPTAVQTAKAQDAAYDLEVVKYADLGVIDSYFGAEEKMEKNARKLLIKAKQIARNGNEYSGSSKTGYILVTNRMYDLLQEKFDDSDATLRHLESQEFKDFVKTFKQAIKAVSERLENIASYSKEILEISRKGFSDANADRSMAAYKLEKHEEWEKFMHFRDKGYN